MGVIALQTPPAFALHCPGAGGKGKEWGEPGKGPRSAGTAIAAGGMGETLPHSPPCTCFGERHVWFGLCWDHTGEDCGVGSLL